MPSRFSCALAATLAVIAAAAQGQSPTVLIPDAPAAPEVRVDQLGDPRGEANRTDRFSSQVSSERDAQPPMQLAPGVPSVAAPPALSRREEGRPGPAAPIFGSDSCDPAIQRSEPDPVCARIIENRAAEYAKPVSQSAEQILLSNQLLGRSASISAAERPTSEATRNVGIAPDTRGDQEFASVVLRSQVRETSPATEPEAPQTNSALADILTSLGIGTDSGVPGGQ